MHIHKTSRLAAAIALATALSACGAGGNGDGSNGGSGSGGNDLTAAQKCTEIENRDNPGTIDSTQGALCDVLDDTVAAPVNNVIANLIEGGPLEDLITQLNDLIGPNGELAPVNELLQTLIGGNEDGALTPVLQGLNAVLIGLLSGDPESIAAALQGFAGDGGSGSDGGLITSVQDVLNTLTGDTPLTELANVVDALLNPESGGLAELTGALDDLTNAQDGQLGPLTELINGLLASDDAALAPVITALNEVLVGLLTNQDPAAIADALQGLADGFGDANPLAGLTPGDDGGSGGSDDGLITSVQGVVDGLLGGTALEDLGGAVDMLVDPDEGTLGALTSVLEGLTAEELAALTDIVDGLIVDETAPLAPVVTTLNDALTGLTGGLLGSLSL